MQHPEVEEASYTTSRRPKNATLASSRGYCFDPTRGKRRRALDAHPYPSCYLFAELHADDVTFAAPGAPDGVRTWWYEDVREAL